jgi:hypothetical protein
LANITSTPFRCSCRPVCHMITCSGKPRPAARRRSPDVSVGSPPKVQRTNEAWIIPRFTAQPTPVPVHPVTTHLGEDFLAFITEPRGPKYVVKKGKTPGTHPERRAGSRAHQLDRRAAVVRFLFSPIFQSPKPFSAFSRKAFALANITSTPFRCSCHPVCHMIG